MEFFTFEFSLEVANKVGGIYQVIKSKAAVSCEELGYSKYVLFGLKYNDRVIHTEVEPCDLENPILQERIKNFDFQKIFRFSKKFIFFAISLIFYPS